MTPSFDDILCQIYNTTDERCIYNVVLLRKLLIELMDIDKYKENMVGSVASLSNAVYSQNIEMIEKEVHLFENKFLTNNITFNVHPLIYMRKISEQGDEQMELFKQLLYFFLKNTIGDRYVIQHLDIWLLNANKNMFREATTEVYAIAT